MIGKIIPRKYGTGSFRDSVNYNLGLSDNDADKVEYVNTLNIFAPEVAAAEMKALALENTRSADPVFNCILSWRENEVPTKEQVDEAVAIALKELGLEGCQAHYALHHNTENLHLHLCVNRIDLETFKARDPAHGWTKKALEKAARKIELAQGWAIERSGRYVVTEDGIIQEVPRGKDSAKLSQTAQDIEAHTGAKSAERLGREIAAPLIRSAQSWEELHQKLAEEGIAFERKGSGATLSIDGVVVKASALGRDISLTKLVARLGEFREHSADIVPTAKHRQPEAIERIQAQPKVESAWERYQKARTEYFNTKKKAVADLRQCHKQDRETLFAEQRQERSELFGISWKGKGDELNRHRSLMAARQQGKTLDLRDNQRREREELKKRFLQKFPSFKGWLDWKEAPELSALYRYPGQLVLRATGESVQRERIDLRNYSPIPDARGKGVKYRRNGGTGTADFIDYGKKIVLTDGCDEATVLAALQLANRQWGAVQISGTERYKRLCVQVAKQYNLKIANPELQAELRRDPINSVVIENPQVGDRVTFRVSSGEAQLTGAVVSINDEERTVTLRVGNKIVPVFRDKGYFVDAIRKEHVTNTVDRQRRDEKTSGWER